MPILAGEHEAASRLLLFPAWMALAQAMALAQLLTDLFALLKDASCGNVVRAHVEAHTAAARWLEGLHPPRSLQRLAQAMGELAGTQAFVHTRQWVSWVRVGVSWHKHSRQRQHA